MRKVDGQEGDGCMIDAKTRESLKIASELLGVDTDALEKAMVTKTMTVSEHHPAVLRIGLPLRMSVIVWRSCVRGLQNFPCSVS